MIVVDLPLRTINPLNTRGSRHWRVAFNMRKKQRGTAHMLVRAALRGNFPRLPTTVRLIRQSAGELDDDGITAALKSVRDGVADAFGVDDSRKSGLRFEYAQERCKRGAYGVRIEIDV